MVSIMKTYFSEMCITYCICIPNIIYNFIQIFIGVEIDWIKTSETVKQFSIYFQIGGDISTTKFL